jgi:cyclohexanone monooxygenase
METMTDEASTRRTTASPTYDVLVVGAGFAGMYALHKLRGLGFRAHVVEAGSDVGGTWYWNRYPGARCDGESMYYSYAFSEELQQEWTWTERYATQPEILRYAGHVADRFDLRRDITFDTRVTAATFDEQARLWRLETEPGARFQARFLIMATGCLSAANAPQIAGLESFKGSVYHTGEWPHESVDFTGRRVAVIGTGSSAIQAIPLIAEKASHLTVFQRTANYAIPAWNAPLDPNVVAAMKAEYPALRDKQRQTLTGNPWDIGAPSALAVSEAERNAEYERRWQIGGLNFIASYGDLLYDPDANATAAEFVRAKIRAIVKDPATAALLCPTDPIGCKRLCVDTNYYATYNRDNVTLVDVARTPITRITPEGPEVAGEVYPADAIVLATGFDAITGALLRVDIKTSEGTALRALWKDGPRTYLGLAVAGVPNLFTITGPQSPSVLTNMIPTIEHHVDWISACLDDLRKADKTRIEAERTAQDAWVGHVGDVAEASLRVDCNSWYIGANVPGKPRVFMPYMAGMPIYRQKLKEVTAAGYAGFSVS